MIFWTTVFRCGGNPIPSKVQVVADFPCPSSVKGLQEFWGIVDFYNHSCLLQSLYEDLTHKKKSDPVEWTLDRRFRR